MADLDRIKAYLPIIDNGQEFEMYPPIRGLDVNRFEYVDYNGTHLKVRNLGNQLEYYVPYALIEFISPGQPLGVLRLRREMLARGNMLV